MDPNMGMSPPYDRSLCQLLQDQLPRRSKCPSCYGNGFVHTYHWINGILWPTVACCLGCPAPSKDIGPTATKAGVLLGQRHFNGSVYVTEPDNDMEPYAERLIRA
jgi:hypothetical protein